ncbi:hypothetical protein J4727_05725 [Providencia rettgeri]|uniref:Carbohydrate-binding domain-containing protein n=1 Tax=Providencia rettgeri TaxID=587 RepID=A0A939NAF6_PRORE|nr:hypothetical protein [Providencia rettgeri]
MGKGSGSQTDFRALWSDDALYFRFIADDKDIQLGDNPDKDQAVLDSDRVELFFATSPELKPYYTVKWTRKGVLSMQKLIITVKLTRVGTGNITNRGEITPNGYVLTGKLI